MLVFTKKLKSFILLFLGTLLTFGLLYQHQCYAAQPHTEPDYYSFTALDYNIDEIATTSNSSLINPDTIPQLLIGFNSFFIPGLAILAYLIIQTILFIKASKSRPLRNLVLSCLGLNLIMILTICLVDTFFNYFFAGISDDTVCSTSTLSFCRLPLGVSITNIAINTLTLVISLIISAKLFKPNPKRQEPLQHKVMLTAIIILAIGLISAQICSSLIPHLHIVEADWGFGSVFDVRRYNLRFREKERVGRTTFLVKQIDDDGVLIEYEETICEKPASAENDMDGIYQGGIHYNGYSDDYTTSRQTIQQKLSWNVNYVYNPKTNCPTPAVDGGTRYYVRFEQ